MCSQQAAKRETSDALRETIEFYKVHRITANASPPQRGRSGKHSPPPQSPHPKPHAQPALTARGPMPMLQWPTSSIHLPFTDQFHASLRLASAATSHAHLNLRGRGAVALTEAPMTAAVDAATTTKAERRDMQQTMAKKTAPNELLPLFFASLEIQTSDQTHRHKIKREQTSGTRRRRRAVSESQKTSRDYALCHTQGAHHRDQAPATAEGGRLRDSYGCGGQLPMKPARVGSRCRVWSPGAIQRPLILTYKYSPARTGSKTRGA
jgi:hypothetical protein